METLVLRLIPALADYPVLLAICSLLLTLYFGGAIFNAVFGILYGRHN